MTTSEYIEWLLSNAYLPLRPDHQERADQAYSQAFSDEGSRKVKYATDKIRELPSSAQERLGDYIAVSIGGADGSDLLGLMKSTKIRKGILLEYDDESAERARLHTKKEIEKIGGTLEVIQGDANQRLDSLVERLRASKAAGTAGLVCLFLGVLHELPRRSPGFELSHFFARLVGVFDENIVFVSEPCAPASPSEMWQVSIPGVSEDLLYEAMRLVRDRLFEGKGDVKKLARGAVRAPASLALEVLHKYIRHDTVERHVYELGERLTQYTRSEFEDALKQWLPNADLASEEGASNGFRRYFRERGVRVVGPDQREKILNSHVKIFAADVGAHRNPSTEEKDGSGLPSSSASLATRETTARVDSVVNIAKDAGTRGGSEPSSLAARLERLYDQQRAQTAGLGNDSRSPRNLSDLRGIGAEAMRRTISSFQHHEGFTGSWIGSHSLPLQLLTQPRLTVDLTPAELGKERPYGMPFESFLDLVKLGFFYLNLRDYDSDKERGFEKHTGEEVGPKLEKLLDVGSHWTYIGSALRKVVFDKALKDSGSSKTYEVFFKQAKEELRVAHACYEALPNDADVVQASLFRGARPSIDAVCWHWAFLSAIGHYLTAGIIGVSGPQGSRLNRLYYDAAKFDSEEGVGQLDHNRGAAAWAFVHLANSLRICHLNFTAPMTASWGTTYNMTEAEYRESARLGIYWGDGSVLSRDEDVNRFLYYMLSDVGDFAHESFRRLREFPAGLTLREGLDQHIFTRGTVDALIGALVKSGDKIQAAARALDPLREAYLSDDIPSPNRLADLVDDYRNIVGVVVKTGLDSIGDEQANRFFTKSNYGVDTIHPWAVRLALVSADHDGDDLLRQFLSGPRAARHIYRVYRILKKS